jgi:DNA (cytosine-5)-methyltransferase 1
MTVDQDLDITDLFCGAGGSALGAHAAGFTVVMAANHWDKAIETHAANFPDTEHDCADISQVDPRRYKRTRVLWASPECTNHSVAKGKSRKLQRDRYQPDLFGETLPDEAAERSRATMWDVPRFAEHHRYDAIIVENVVEAAKWVLWPAWLHAMTCLGYEHELVFLNSMHAPAMKTPRAPQSRDRMYVVLWRKCRPRPDVDPRPLAWCESCGTDVAAVQSFKNGIRWGRYRAQYVYRCPNDACRRAVVEPYADPAASVIDWSLPGQVIGDRDRPLAPKTIARIEAGLTKYAGELLVPVEGRVGKEARPANLPLRTMTTRNETGLLVPYYGTGVARPVAEPMPTMTTIDTAGVAFIAELRGGGSKARHVREPMATVTASGNHHMLIEAKIPRAEDCTFRMLQPSEIQGGMAFRPDYVVVGNRREKVRQLGNGVTPPASEFLLAAVAATL